MTIDAPRESFWSRRLRAVEAEAKIEEAIAAQRRQDAARAVQEERDAAQSDAEILHELGLKDPDLLAAGDDFAAFMSAAVPERLRRRALRVLWRSNPVLANLDGLVDHGEDFSDAAMVMPDMKTTYQVGRGMLEHINALARAQEAEENAAAQTLAAESGDASAPALTQTAPAAMDRPAPDPVAEPEPAGSVAQGPRADRDAPDPEQNAPPDLPRPRHMRFSFAD